MDRITEATRQFLVAAERHDRAVHRAVNRAVKGLNEVSVFEQLELLSQTRAALDGLIDALESEIPNIRGEVSRDSLFRLTAVLEIAFAQILVSEKDSWNVIVFTALDGHPSVSEPALTKMGCGSYIDWIKGYRRRMETEHQRLPAAERERIEVKAIQQANVLASMIKALREATNA